LNPFDLFAAENDIKLSACKRSAHSLEEKLGIADAMGVIECLDRLPAKVEANSAIGRVVHNHTDRPTKGWQRQVTQADR